MLNYRGIAPRELFSSEFISTPWGRTMWAKLGLAVSPLAFQVAVGHRPAKLVDRYLAVSMIIVGISVMLVNHFSCN